VLVQYLSLEFGLHATMAKLIRSDPTEDLVADALGISGQICSATDSRHVSEFINLGMIELIKQRLIAQLSCPRQSPKVAINAAYTLSNILADPEVTICHEVLRSRLL
jgi:hypothetical protein